MNRRRKKGSAAAVFLCLIAGLLLVINIYAMNRTPEDEMPSGEEAFAGQTAQQTESTAPDAGSAELTQIVAQPEYAVYVGDALLPEIELVPASADAVLTFESADSLIARVDEQGAVTGAAEGRTTITVHGTPDVTASFEIVVKKKMPDPAKDYPPLFEEKHQIVNVWNPLSEDYVPEVVEAEGVVPVKASSLSMTAEALEHYERLYKDCLEATGERVLLITGYRSYATQRYIHDNAVDRYRKQGYSKADAAELAGRTVQPPGNSEHQLGLAVDIGDTLSVSNTFHKTKVGEWVTAHAHEYGWILRYPEDKTDITGIGYEPWHFRFVGVEHATYIYEHGLCLEEYDKLQDEAAQNALDYSREHPAVCD